MAAVNTDLTVTLKAINQTNAAFAQFNKNLSDLKNAALKIGAAIGGALAIRDTINTMEEWTRQVREVQNVTGLAADEASRLAFVGRAVGVSADELSTSLDRMAKQMFNTHTETGKTEDRFTKWGIALKNADGSIKNGNDLLIAAAERVKTLGNGYASAALEQDLFGRSGGRMHDLLMLGAEGVRALERESDELNMTLSGGTLLAMRQFQIRSNVLGMAFDALKIQLGLVFLPVLTAIVNGLIKLSAWIQNNILHSRVFAGAIKVLGDAFSLTWGILKGLAEKIASFFGSFAADPAKAITALIDWLKENAPKLGTWILDNIPIWLRNLGDLIHRSLTWLRETGIPSLVNSLEEAVPKLAAWITDSLPTWTEKFGELIGNIVGWLIGTGIPDLVGAFYELIKHLPAWINAIWLWWLHEGVPTVFRIARGFAEELVKGIGSGLARLGESLSRLLKDAFDSIDFDAGPFHLHRGTWSIDFASISFGVNVPGLTPSPGAPPPGSLGGGGAGAIIPGPIGALASIATAAGAIYQAVSGVQTQGFNVGGRFMPLAPYQRGGIVTRPTAALLGEAGPEMVVPLGRGAGSPTIIVNASGNIAASEQELAQRIAAAVGEVIIRQVVVNRQLAY